MMNLQYGVVEDVSDPKKIGRVRVRIVGYHSENKNDIPTEDLPWSLCLSTNQSASVSGVGTSTTGIKPGSRVICTFEPQTGQSVVLGTIPGLISEKPNSETGFSDPTESYPREDYLEEPDTNRLARNDNIENTIVQVKKDQAESDIAIANSDETWNETETPYNTQYPLNTVHESESGHIFEVDDTPGAERLHVHHKSGTFIEVHPSGRVVVKSQSGRETIVLSEDRVYVDGNYSLTVSNNSAIRVNERFDIEVVEKDLNVVVNKGDMNLRLRDGNMFAEIVGDVIQRVEGDVEETIEGSKKEKVAGDLEITAEGIVKIRGSNIFLN